MTNTKNNQEEDREWVGYAMKGGWDGSGSWNEDGKWSGHGKWHGGLISGTWDGKGDWESSGNGSGKWNGGGELISTVSFQKNGAVRLVAVIGSVAIIGLTAVAVIGLISNGLVVGGIVAIMLLFIAVSVIGQRTTKGKWWGEGVWKDDGDFRILDMTGVWKLGHHEGKIKGIMKDHIPS